MKKNNLIGHRINKDSPIPVVIAIDESQRDFLDRVYYCELEDILKFIAFGWNEPSSIEILRGVDINDGVPATE